MSSARGVATVIEAYTPVGIAPEAAVFARQVVARAAPGSASRAKAWLFGAGRIGAFAMSVGLPLEPEVVLAAAVIERFVWEWGSQFPVSTRRTVRSALRSLSKRIDPAPPPLFLSRDRVKRPYSAVEIAGFLALADAQPTLARRMRASGLICLGAGAGLVGADLRAVTGRHVMARSGGLIVEVTARNARTVPVLGAYHQRLGPVAGFFGDRFIVGGVDLARRNVTTPLIASLSGGADLPRLELGRLRSTWLAAVAEQIGLRAFLDAAGVVCSQRLGDIAAGLPAASEQQAVALLGGTP
jgi:integrase